MIDFNRYDDLQASHDELLFACTVARNAIETLICRVITIDPTFLPTQSLEWTAFIACRDAIEHGEKFAQAKNPERSTP